jgi:hypothetical protein
MLLTLLQAQRCVLRVALRSFFVGSIPVAITVTRISSPNSSLIDVPKILDIEPARSNDGQSAFGEWDIRKEENIRPKVEDTQFDNIEKNASFQRSCALPLLFSTAKEWWCI